MRATQQLHLQLNPGRGHDRRVGVTVGEGSVFLDPSHTAVLIDKLTTALDAYAATLTAVA